MILDDDRRAMIDDNLDELLNRIRIDGTDLLDYMKEEHNIEGKTVTALSDKDITALNASYQSINDHTKMSVSPIL